jgi:hypothetical protein
VYDILLTTDEEVQFIWPCVPCHDPEPRRTLLTSSFPESGCRTPSCCTFSSATFLYSCSCELLATLASSVRGGAQFPAMQLHPLRRHRAHATVPLYAVRLLPLAGLAGPRRAPRRRRARHHPRPSRCVPGAAAARAHTDGACRSICDVCAIACCTRRARRGVRARDGRDGHQPRDGGARDPVHRHLHGHRRAVVHPPLRVRVAPPAPAAD